jgi:uncharacterized protein (DUF2141 family)
VLTVLLTLFAPAVNASELRITVEGIRSPQGTLLIGLYDSFESFTRAIESAVLNWVEACDCMVFRGQYEMDPIGEATGVAG